MSSFPVPRRNGRLEHHRMKSRALGIFKQYYIYLPPGYSRSSRRYPVLFLFRGHEREWINPVEDASRGGQCAVDIAERLIAERSIVPMIIVMPGLSSDDNIVPSLGINMLEPPRGRPGIGTGRFGDFLTGEFIPFIDAHYRTIRERKRRGADGFSLGGYVATRLAIERPPLFGSVGSYDGTFMWYDLYDPRLPGARNNDRLWLRNGMFDAVFGERRDIPAMKAHNPLNLLARMDGETFEEVRSIRFHIHCAAFDGQQGNRDRTMHFVSHLQRHGIENSARQPVLRPRAVHDWRHADLHLTKTLPLHSAVFET